MPHKGPHISIQDEQLVPRVLGITEDDFAAWPEAVRELAQALAAEMFLVRYNPFIDSGLVQSSVSSRLERDVAAQAGEYADIIRKGVQTYWDEYQKDQVFKVAVIKRLGSILSEEDIIDSPNSLIETSTDATDLRMELPMLMLTPTSTEQVRDVVRLADEMGFCLIPRGGGTGLTGGAIPAHRRTVILSVAKLKKIISIDKDSKILTAQAGVLTLNAINAVDAEGLLFTVDPASKAGSSLGGNIAENSGGPFAFEYGTTLDNIASFTMVKPDGQIITVTRRDHPLHKIMPEEAVLFDITEGRREDNGSLLETITMRGDEIRGKNLGKDVTNKYLGGLPGVQKEGVDGIITECSFTLYHKPALSRTLCLEFFGRSMKNAMFVIKDVVGLRDHIREQGDLVKISALEEFGPKYVKAIEYVKKSARYEGDPISVLLLQLDSDDQAALDDACDRIVDMALQYEEVDIFAAKDQKEAEFFWEDRHKLSAIAKRTSGFKINEDIVIPLEVIPEFADFIEDLNLYYLAKAYRKALSDVTDLRGVKVDEAISSEMLRTGKILREEIRSQDLSEQELLVQVGYFFNELAATYEEQSEAIHGVFELMLATRIEIANHMHAGDGNCHVNLPVDSNNPEMMENAHEAAGKVFEKVLSLSGCVTGEHGVGITKIAFLEEDKITALKAYKLEVDPKGIINPGKLIQRELTVTPYTFSFNRLIQDIGKTALPDKERLTEVLRDIQTCTRCGKCKQVCPMYHPERDMMFHPRNKNISLGALVEAIYYSLLHTGKPDKALLAKLRRLMEHCTGCGKCMASCPVKIDSAKAAMSMRAFLEEKKAGGHPIKTQILSVLAKSPHKRLPATAKFLSTGQKVQEAVSGFVPASWRKKIQNPAISGPNPQMGFVNLDERLGLGKGWILAPGSVEDSYEAPETVYYFPGCGASLFTSDIGLASVYLLLKAEISIILPSKHLCCGYPLLSQGMEEAYHVNFGRNLAEITSALSRAGRKGYTPSTVLTSCGTCRETLHKYGIESTFGQNAVHKDVVQFLLERLSIDKESAPESILYHAACHAEWSDVAPAKAASTYRSALAKAVGTQVEIAPGCCGESGMGAMTSPAIYNRIRAKKQAQLALDFKQVDESTPVVVGCPSCRIGIQRSLMAMGEKRRVLHTLELLAELSGGPNWKQEILDKIKASYAHDMLRLVPEF